MDEPDFENFSAEIMQCWPWGDVDGFMLQEIAEKHGMIVKIEGGFDPEKHEDPTGSSGPGDDFFARNYGNHRPKKWTGGPASTDPKKEAPDG